MAAPTRADLPPVKRPSEPKRPPVYEFAKLLLDQIPWYCFGERRVARAIAAEHAETAYQVALQSHAQEVARYEARVAEREEAIKVRALEREAETGLLARAHERLAAGHPPASERGLFEGLQSTTFPSRFVGWFDGAAVVRVQVPGAEVVPERKLAITPGGQPTTKKRPQGEQNDALAEIVAAATLEAGRAALAAAPGVVDVVVVSFAPDGTAVAEGRFRRGSLGSGNDPVDVLLANGGLISQSGRTRTLDPIEIDDLRLADLLDAAPGGVS